MEKKSAHPESVRLESGRVVKVVTTVDSEGSRKQFQQLNSHKTGGKVAMPNPGPLAEGDDTDIVDVKLSGPTTEVVSDGGGRRFGGARVNVVFWGSEWLSNPQPSPSINDILSDIENILTSSYFDALSQYGVYDAPGGFASFVNAWVDHRDVPPYQFTTVDINYEAWLMMTSGPIDDGSSTLVCVIMPPSATPNANDRGAHDRSLQPNFNWIPTMWIKFNSRSQISSTFSHEMVEILTDPDGDGIQLEPTSRTSWNEIGDVCNNINGLLNGVSVQSYWSARDSACVIPTPVAVQAWQIMCIHKRGERDNPNENISIVGGIHIPSRDRFWMRQVDAIQRIENGDMFFVLGNDGSQSQVVVRTHFPAWAPQGSKYITTISDDSKQDNLLNLPDCGPLQDWNS